MSTDYALLIERHADMVYGAALRQVKNQAIAEDVTQAVFMILLRRAATIRDPRFVGAWLMQTTRYCARDAMKRERRRKMHESRALAKSTPQQDVVALHEMSDLLDAALATLSHADREVLILRYWQQQSIAEVASRMGVSAESAKKRIRRAVERLRQFFSRRGIHADGDPVDVTLTVAGCAAAPSALKSSCAAFTLAGITSHAATAGAVIARSTLMKLKLSKITIAVSATLVLILIGVSSWRLSYLMRSATPTAPAAVMPGDPPQLPVPPVNLGASFAVKSTVDPWYISGIVPNPGIFSASKTQTVRDSLLQAGVPEDTTTAFAVRLIRRTRADFEAVEDLTIAPGLSGPAAEHSVRAGDALLVNSAGAGFQFSVWDSKPFLATLPAENSGGIAIAGSPSADGEFTWQLGDYPRPGETLSLKEHPFTVFQTLAAAGLGENLVWPYNIFIQHADQTHAEINPRELLSGKIPDCYIRAGDHVYFVSVFYFLGGDKAGTWNITSPHMTIKEAINMIGLEDLPETQTLWLARGRDPAGNIIQRSLDIHSGWTGRDVDLEVKEWDIFTLRPLNDAPK